MEAGMTVAAPTVGAQRFPLTFWPFVGGLRRQHTSITESELVPIATSPAPPIDYQELRKRAALDWASNVIEPLRALPPNWDSYGADPVDGAVARLGIRLLAGLALERVSPPQAFPTADGGLSLEWHRPDLDFVISIARPDDEPPSAYFRAAAEEWEVNDILRVPDPRIGTVLSLLMEG